MRKCQTPYCRRRVKTGKYCSTCRSRVSRANNPIRHAYNNLKAHAKERGKVFTITLEYFTKFCHTVKYIGFSGRKADSHTVDRIREELGYIPGNLQILPNAANTKKYFTYNWQTKEIFFTNAATSEPKEDFDTGFEQDDCLQ